jgi:hypothetical protein
MEGLHESGSYCYEAFHKSSSSRDPEGKVKLKTDGSVEDLSVK